MKGKKAVVEKINTRRKNLHVAAREQAKCAWNMGKGMQPFGNLNLHELLLHYPGALLYKVRP